MKALLKIVFTCVCISLIIQACKHDAGTTADPIADSNYPTAVANILVSKCATAGCHNTQSKDAASGLDLSTWDKLLNGNRGGAAVIPYSVDQSPLLYFVNTDSTLGIVLKPTMPVNAPPLSQSEYLTLQSWIANGAPDKYGNVYFANSAGSKKYYISNQGCDLIAVCDAQRRVIARYIKIGANANATEVPHTIKMTPDGKYWCAVFYAGNIMQKFRTTDDSLVGTATITSGGWSSITYSANSDRAYITDLLNGQIVEINLNTMAQVGPNYNVYPGAHGIAINPNTNYMYVTDQYGVQLTKAPINDLANTDKVNIGAGAHEIVFSPDSSKYFLTCDASDDVRVFNALNDTLLAIIPTGANPVEMSFSLSHPYLFVTCLETPNTSSAYRGSVMVINYLTNTVVSEVKNGFFEPHGLAVNDDDNIVYVASRNYNPGGPPPHHISSCGGRNGFLTIIDMNTLQIIPGYKNELSVDPYSVFYRK